MIFAPPSTTQVTFKKGMTHIGVWAIQRCLNSFTDWNEGKRLAEDGEFGEGTEAWIKAYQDEVGLTPDGIVGPATQARMAKSCRYRADPNGTLPKGLIDGLIAGESGGLIAAVNTQVSGGIDCGYTQRRILSPYTEEETAEAFDSLFQVKRFAEEFKDKFNQFSTYPAVKARADRTEYAWRLAALNHNWPYGAAELAAGRVLSTRTATWVHPSTKFTDGAAVTTYRDWASFYAIGSKEHNHKGLVVAQAFGVPAI